MEPNIFYWLYRPRILLGGLRGTANKKILAAVFEMSLSTVLLCAVLRTNLANPLYLLQGVSTCGQNWVMDQCMNELNTSTIRGPTAWGQLGLQNKMRNMLKLILSGLPSTQILIRLQFIFIFMSTGVNWDNRTRQEIFLHSHNLQKPIVKQNWSNDLFSYLV